MASVSDLKPPTSQDNTDPDEANEKSIMNLLLAAAAKCKNHQPNGMVKAASTSELEASNSQSLANDPELEPVRKKKYSNKLSMKAREGWKYVLVDSPFSIQTVSEWVFQQVIFWNWFLLFKGVLSGLKG